MPTVMSTCPACGKPAPKKAIFCVSCHFALPRPYWSLCVRMRAEAANAADDEDRRHLAEQAAAYVRVCVRQLRESGHA